MSKGLRLRWRLDKHPSGLAGVCAGPRGSTLYDSTGKRYAMVSAINRGGSGWYWVAGWDSDVPRRNTCNQPVPTIDEAKAEAMAYVRAALARTGDQS